MSALDMTFFFRTAHHANLKHVSGWHKFQDSTPGTARNVQHVQDRNSSVHLTDVQVFVYDGGVINNLACRRFDQ